MAQATGESVVRSDGESPRNVLYLAEKFRATEKYFDVSLAEIERQLDRNGGETELRCESEVTDENGDLVAAELRLNLNCRSTIRRNWTASLKLHRERIDGIDYESRFPTGNDEWGRGWHRHSWDERLQSAKNKERGKCPVAGFDDERLGRGAFLIRVFKELRIRLSPHDHGTDELSFD